MKTRNLLNLAVLTLAIASCGSKSKVDSTLPKLEQGTQPNSVVTELQKKLKDAENKKKEDDKKINQLTQDLTNKTTELSNRNKELKQKQEKVVELNNQIEILKASGNASQAKITELKGKVSQLENDVKESEKEKKKVEDKVSELNGKVDELTREKNEKQTAINSLNNQIETLKASGNASQTKITELEGKVSQLENDVKESEKEKKKVEDKVSELNGKVDELTREKNKKDKEIEKLKNQLKIQGDTQLRAEIALKEKEIEILKSIYDKNNPRYKDITLISGKQETSHGEGDDVIKLERQGKHYVYTAITDVNKKIKFTDDDFELGTNGNEIASKTENLNFTKSECIAGREGEPCDESKIPELKTALAKYEATVNQSDLNNLTDTEKEYICRMDGGICRNDNGQTVLKAYNELGSDNKKGLGWIKTILNEGKRKLEITYDLSVKGTMEKGGSAVKLTYSDFGMFKRKIDINSVNTDISDPVVKAEIEEALKQDQGTYPQTSYFIQGIDELKATVNVGSNDMIFKGKTFAQLQKQNCNGDCSEALNGDVKLSVTGATATGNLDLDFGSSLNLKATDLDLTKDTFQGNELYNKFTATGTKIAGYTKHDPNGTKLNLNMYGPEADKPTEAVGMYNFGFQRNCHGGPECEELRLKGAFGAKKE